MHVIILYRNIQQAANFFEVICVLPSRLPVMVNYLTAKLLRKKYITRVLIKSLLVLLAFTVIPIPLLKIFDFFNVSNPGWINLLDMHGDSIIVSGFE